MRATATVLLLFAAVTAFAAEPPERAQTRFTPEGFVTIFGRNFRVEIPQTFVYNASGEQVFELKGYGPGMLGRVKGSVRGKANPKALKLDEFAALITDLKGQPYGAAINTYPTLVALGAEWCAPCRQLHKELEKLEGFNIVEVDADPKKIGLDEIKKVIEGAKRP